MVVANQTWFPKSGVFSNSISLKTNNKNCLIVPDNSTILSYPVEKYFNGTTKGRILVAFTAFNRDSFISLFCN